VTDLIELRGPGELRAAPGDGGDVAYEPEMNFAAVLHASLGQATLQLELPEWDGPPATAAEKMWRALHEVSDPEFPISIVDLGLVYDVRLPEEGVVTVTISFTATACPCMDFIKWDIRERLLQEPEVREVRVETTWDPPWTNARISERGREALRRAGVSI
jgi:metal-sulfur cluster biosynthetic enzyme